MLLLLVLDRHHLGDPLFVRRLARDLRAHVGPVALVHDSAEAGERALEGEGVDAVRVDGRLRTRTEAERALVERALREQNRRIAHELNEEGVPVVRMLASDRGLLRETDGVLEAGGARWLAALAAKGAVPLVGALVAGVEVDAAGAAAALARALEDATILFLTTDGRAGLFDAGTRRASVASLPMGAPAGDAEGVRRVSGAVRVRLTTPAALRGAGLPDGTDVGHFAEAAE